MNRTITVTGSGKISRAPDQITLSLEISRTDKEYDMVVKSADDAIVRLTDAVKNAGLDAKELRTQSYQISADYESIADKKGNFQRVFNGYVCRIQMVVRFPLDKKRLGLALRAITGCGANPEISITFGLADEDAAKAEMLLAAARDAREKAQVLASAAKVSLGSLQSIRYAWDEVHFESPTECGCFHDIAYECKSGVSGAENLTPEDVERTDTATFVWEIL